ncbi:MAG: hypothetical protein KGL35_20645 [Bradyrhizobium sp.]|nr:hypothetical protein [Bradyrhizobium sp.]
MSTFTISRLATTDEIAAEMDRRGDVIERLETNVRHWRDECGKLHAQIAVDKDITTNILQAYEMEKRVLYEALERALSHLAVIGTDQAKRAAEEIEAVLSETSSA